MGSGQSPQEAAGASPPPRAQLTRGAPLFLFLAVQLPRLLLAWHVCGRGLVALDLLLRNAGDDFIVKTFIFICEHAALERDMTLLRAGAHLLFPLYCPEPCCQQGHVGSLAMISPGPGVQTTAAQGLRAPPPISSPGWLLAPHRH